ncbi:helix-turn-helix transcriptional regulator [Bacillus sp. RG28]|uniref:Helix-turn-helix transcriptional regulator n=1 Tax=Gottfriedia endophytica TaxID=2820819 RepID=A0A940NS28_9BACI|nr:helix-turn-helix transcriptional regulator [Gottfriedia endophytica]MBP0726780.1 helix-turn-helix transcriptional regulator [Gottfriedia endophytica]
MKCIQKIKHEKYLEIDGVKLKLFRLSRGWNLTRLALESGVTRKTIGEIEKGKKTNIRFSTINEIANALEIKIEFFCTQNEM